MDVSEALKLIEAGFTPEQIRAEIQKEEAPKGSNGVPDTGDQSRPEDPEHESEVVAQIGELNKTVTDLKETIRMLQEANIKNVSSGSSSVGNPVDENIRSFLSTL